MVVVVAAVVVSSSDSSSYWSGSTVVSHTNSVGLMLSFFTQTAFSTVS